MENEDVFPIVLFTNPILKSPILEEVSWVTEEHRALVRRMIRTMYHKRGCGLAANQVGLNIRVIVYDSGDGAKVMFNPYILSKDHKKEVGGEGCLSFPKMLVPVKRHKAIHVRYRDLDNVVREAVFCDFEARVIQHEIDHINGIVFTQRR